MSMNLTCAEVELWQTPTYITYMCYSNEDGGWQGIKYRYIQWVKSLTNGVYNTKAEIKQRNDLQNRIQDHIKELDSFDELHFDII
jgi:hypothetical protein